MRVLVAMSGGVDSSVAAALLQADGHEVVGATMKLWGGPTDSGCCSVADVEDARAVCRRLGIDHHVFNFGAEFERDVVGPYVDAHMQGRTPNPCVACNRHLKFDRFAERSRLLGFDAMATGHHAAVIDAGPGGPWELRRGADEAKDQSYVLHMLGQADLARLLLPVGTMTKAEVRRRAGELGLPTATKPDSQDVCFIPGSDRSRFLGGRTELHPGRVVDGHGETVGRVDAVELVTIGQRRGLGNPGGRLPPGERRYVTGVDRTAAVVTVGPVEDLLVDAVALDQVTWTASPPGPGEALEAQLSAHGAPVAARWVAGAGPATGTVAVSSPVRRPAPGQSVALYQGDRVVGGGLAR